MSVIKVTVAQWGALLQNNTINAADTYTIVDTAQNIAGLPATQIAGDFLVGIESTDTSLMLDAAQAEAVLNITQDGETAPPYVQLSAPSGDQVILVDSFANVTSLSSFYIAQLESAGLNAVDITATAADIAALTEFADFGGSCAFGDSYARENHIHGDRYLGRAEHDEGYRFRERGESGHHSDRRAHEPDGSSRR